MTTLTDPREPTPAEIAEAVEQIRAGRAIHLETQRSDRAKDMETERSDRAIGVEANRVDRAMGIEAARVDRATDVEANRVDRAVGVESNRVDRADIVEADRHDRADTAEADRLFRAKVAESNRATRALRVQKQFWFLAIFLVVAFVLLAIRSEKNAASNEANTLAIKSGLYQTCQATAARTTQINPGREALTTLLITLVNNDDTLTAQQKIDAEQTLHDGLVVPVVNCGVPPK